MSDALAISSHLETNLSYTNLLAKPPTTQSITIGHLLNSRSWRGVEPKENFWEAKVLSPVRSRTETGLFQQKLHEE